MISFYVGSDSACDLSETDRKRLDILMVPFYVSFDETGHQKEKTELSVTAFYETLVAHPEIFPKTSVPSVADFLDVFRPLAETGTPLIFFCISAKLSSSYSGAVMAKNMILEEYPSWPVAIIDSLCASGQQGLLVLETVRMREDGLSFVQAVSTAEALKETGCIFFTTNTLEYLQKGGRIGQVLKMAAVALKIKPLIALRDGELFPIGMARSRKKSLNALLEEAKRFFSKHDCNLYRLGTGGGYHQEEAQAFHEQLKNQMKEIGYNEEIVPFQIGATIGVHTGPHPLGIGLIQKYENIK